MPGRNKPWKFMHITVDQVYRPLAQMQRQTKDEGDKKLHQLLSDIGVKALGTHLGQLPGIAQISSTKEEYERHVVTIFGGQQRLDIWRSFQWLPLLSWR